MLLDTTLEPPIEFRRLKDFTKNQHPTRGFGTSTKRCRIPARLTASRVWHRIALSSLDKGKEYTMNSDGGSIHRNSERKTLILVSRFTLADSNRRWKGSAFVARRYRIQRIVATQSRSRRIWKRPILLVVVWRRHGMDASGQHHTATVESLTYHQ